MSDQVSQKLSFMNVTPIFIGNEGFTASEIRRQYHEVGLCEFALSLSIHPQGNPPRKRVDTKSTAGEVEAAAESGMELKQEELMLPVGCPE